MKHWPETTQEISLSSVPYRSGTVRLIALDDGAPATGSVPGVAAGPRFVEQVLGAGVPSLDASNRATSYPGVSWVR